VRFLEEILDQIVAFVQPNGSVGFPSKYVIGEPAHLRGEGINFELNKAGVPLSSLLQQHGSRGRR
jgi:hypothetical protein